MKHFFKSVHFDGKFYNYVCNCGLVVSTPDGIPPISHDEPDVEPPNNVIQSEDNG